MKIKRICKTCGKKFFVISSRIKKGEANFCSHGCANKTRIRKIKRNCLICGKQFYAKPSRIKRYNVKFCSHKCKGIWWSQNMQGKNNPNYKNALIKKICPICNKEFIIQKSIDSICCSRKCSGIKHSLDTSGEKHPCWKGGIGKLPYPFDFNKELKELIRKRDNYICQFPDCYAKENGKKHCVHHIDYNKNNLNPSNLLTLCRKHNIKINYNRKYWEKYFKISEARLKAEPDLLL